jgi:phosphoglycolate phosphatase
VDTNKENHEQGNRECTLWENRLYNAAYLCFFGSKNWGVVMTWIAFDMDGTLYDCGSIIEASLQKGVADFIEESGTQLDAPTLDDILSFVGIPTHLIFKQLFPELVKEEYDRVNDLCSLRLAEDVRSGGGYVYEGVPEIMRVLAEHNYQMVIASNGRKSYVQAILETHSLMPYFPHELVVINNDTVCTKNDIVAYYKKYMARDELLIMVGDRHSDRDAARVNNVPFIGCAFGHAAEKEIAGSRWIVEHVREIPEVVAQIEAEYML